MFSLDYIGGSRFLLKATRKFWQSTWYLTLRLLTSCLKWNPLCCNQNAEAGPLLYLTKGRQHWKEKSIKHWNTYKFSGVWHNFANSAIKLTQIWLTSILLRWYFFCVFYASILRSYLGKNSVWHLTVFLHLLVLEHTFATSKRN